VVRQIHRRAGELLRQFQPWVVRQSFLECPLLLSHCTGCRACELLHSWIQARACLHIHCYFDGIISSRGFLHVVRRGLRQLRRLYIYFLFVFHGQLHNWQAWERFHELCRSWWRYIQSRHTMRSNIGGDTPTVWPFPVRSLALALKSDITFTSNPPEYVQNVLLPALKTAHVACSGAACEFPHHGDKLYGKAWVSCCARGDHFNDSVSKTSFLFLGTVSHGRDSRCRRHGLECLVL
jgi:hypothetical protein